MLSLILVGELHVLIKEWIEVEFLTQLRKVVRDDVHPAWSVDDCHPPSHEFELDAFDDGIVAVVEHDPFDSDTVADVGEGAAVTDMVILFDSEKEGFGFADVGVEEFFVWETKSATEATWEKSEPVNGDVK
jgi:hypothetical protein